MKPPYLIPGETYYFQHKQLNHFIHESMGGAIKRTTYTCIYECMIVKNLEKFKGVRIKITKLPLPGSAGNSPFQYHLGAYIDVSVYSILNMCPPNFLHYEQKLPTI